MNYELERTVPLYRQIRGRLEEMILCGRLKAGDRLPTTKELAKDFGVTLQTAQTAVSLLSRRGILERIPGRGTFVSARINSRRIGIAFGTNIFGRHDMLFFQSLYPLIAKELKRLEWNSSLFFPAGDESSWHMIAELDRETQGGGLRGLIYLAGDYPYSEWFANNSQIPQTSGGFLSDSGFKEESDEYRGLDYLLGRGFRRIAVISHIHDAALSLPSSVSSDAERAYAKHGLPMQAIFARGTAASHREGIERAREVLKGRKGGWPDAFLVLNDQACMGVIFELLSRRLRIPQDIAVMASSNKGIEIPCPCALTRLEKDPEDLARLLVEDVIAKIEDREPRLAPWKSALIVGKSCGE